MKIPEFLIKLLTAQYSEEEANRILTGYAVRRPVTFRVNLLKATKEEIEAECAALGITLQSTPVPNAYFVENLREREIAQTPLYQSGKIYLQSLSSMLPPYLLAPERGENILDMTAAPGGKTSLLSVLSGGEAFLTACEKDKIRAERLKYNIAKLGVPRTSVLVQDALLLNEFYRFDKILLDAPCSGSGTLTPDGENKISEKLVENSVKLQEKLLRKALKLLKKGSVMVYSTCSVLKEENEGILEKVLKEGDFELLPPELPFSVPHLESMKNTLLVPPDGAFEGFFCA
ncbi:MAG: RsmB/NOP family class I SAM-dependent RNA methyltransferase, partial [Clostridia bacterium]|nr:RsmB/NOP family class I SAM-dependent RNA methyltransferase [Clostridia bacterium]